MKKLLSILTILFLCTLSWQACSNDDNTPASTSPGQKKYQLKNIIPVEGRQGIAIDNNYYYVSSSTALFKYDKKGNLLLKNEKPFVGFDKEVNHFGDIDVSNGEIYTGVEWFEFGEVRNIQIAVYDASTLTYKYSIDFGTLEQPEVCGISIDKDKHWAWMADWTKGDYVYKYDLVARKYLGKVKLTPAPKQQQGVLFVDGKLLITADDGDADLNQSDNVYLADVSDNSKTEISVSHFRSFPEFKRAGEIEGLSIDPITHDLVVLNNRGAIIKQGMPIGFYPGYTTEIHELYVFEQVK